MDRYEYEDEMIRRGQSEYQAAQEYQAMAQAADHFLKSIITEHEARNYWMGARFRGSFDEFCLHRMDVIS